MIKSLIIVVIAIKGFLIMKDTCAGLIYAKPARLERIAIFVQLTQLVKSARMNII